MEPTTIALLNCLLMHVTNKDEFKFLVRRELNTVPRAVKERRCRQERRVIRSILQTHPCYSSNQYLMKAFQIAMQELAKFDRSTSTGLGEHTVMMSRSKATTGKHVIEKITHLTHATRKRIRTCLSNGYRLWVSDPTPYALMVRSTGEMTRGKVLDSTLDNILVRFRSGKVVQKMIIFALSTNQTPHKPCLIAGQQKIPNRRSGTFEQSCSMKNKPMYTP